MPDRPGRQTMSILAVENIFLIGSTDRTVADLRHVANQSPIFEVIFGRVRPGTTIHVLDG